MGVAMAQWQTQHVDETPERRAWKEKGYGKRWLDEMDTTAAGGQA